MESSRSTGSPPDSNRSSMHSPRGPRGGGRHLSVHDVLAQARNALDALDPWQASRLLRRRHSAPSGSPMPGTPSVGSPESICKSLPATAQSQSSHEVSLEQGVFSTVLLDASGDGTPTDDQGFCSSSSDSEEEMASPDTSPRNQCQRPLGLGETIMDRISSAFLWLHPAAQTYENKNQEFFRNSVSAFLYREGKGPGPKSEEVALTDFLDACEKEQQKRSVLSSLHEDIEKTLKRLADNEIDHACLMGLPSLHWLVLYGEVELIERYLESVRDDEGKKLHHILNASVMATSLSHIERWGMKALHLAVRAGRPRVVDLLLRQGADVNAEVTTGRLHGMTPICAAVNIGNGVEPSIARRIFWLLYNHGGVNFKIELPKIDVSKYETPLHFFAREGGVYWLKEALFLEKQSEPIQRLRRLILEKNHQALTEFFEENPTLSLTQAMDFHGNTAFHLVASKSDPKSFAVLTRHEALPPCLKNSGGDTVLHALGCEDYGSSNNDKKEIFSAILKAAGDESEELINTCNTSHLTPLAKQLQRRTCSLTYVEALVSAGAVLVSDETAVASFSDPLPMVLNYPGRSAAIPLLLARNPREALRRISTGATLAHLAVSFANLAALKALTTALSRAQLRELFARRDANNRTPFQLFKAMYDEEWPPYRNFLEIFEAYGSENCGVFDLFASLGPEIYLPSTSESESGAESEPESGGETEEEKASRLSDLLSALNLESTETTQPLQTRGILSRRLHELARKKQKALSTLARLLKESLNASGSSGLAKKDKASTHRDTVSFETLTTFRQMIFVALKRRVWMPIGTKTTFGNKILDLLKQSKYSALKELIRENFREPDQQPPEVDLKYSDLQKFSAGDLAREEDLGKIFYAESPFSWGGRQEGAPPIRLENLRDTSSGEVRTSEELFDYYCQKRPLAPNEDSVIKNFVASLGLAPR